MLSSATDLLTIGNTLASLGSRMKSREAHSTWAFAASLVSEMKLRKVLSPLAFAAFFLFYRVTITSRRCKQLIRVRKLRMMCGACSLISELSVLARSSSEPGNYFNCCDIYVTDESILVIILSTLGISSAL